MIEVVRQGQTVQVISTFSPVGRAFWLVVSLIPWLAPYELIVKVNWNDYFNWYFAFVLVICLGAIAVSIFVALFALAGLSQSLTLDFATSLGVYEQQAPIVKRSVRRFALGDIRSVETRTEEWSEGSPTHHLDLTIADGSKISVGYSTQKPTIDALVDELKTRLAGK